MARRPDAPSSIEKVVEESRFLMRTLLREDLFGSVVSLSEAEKLLEPSLSLGFVEYCAFLKRGGYLNIDRSSNTVAVTDRGRRVSEGMEDANLISEAAKYFTQRLEREEKARSVSTSAEMPSPMRGTAAPPPPPLPPPASSRKRQSAPGDELLADRYLRYESLGQGSLGSVYRGKNIVLGIAVALKEVQHVFEFVSYLSRDEILTRLSTETLSQAALSHPHILSILDVVLEAPTPFIVSEFASGGSLKERMHRIKTAGQTMPVSITMCYLLQSTYALTHAHAHGMVHGNLKPENVLFDDMGNVKLSDFGMSRVTEKSAAMAGPVYVGMGSPSYMAPEQLHGNGSIGPAADIYALGIMLYEMLTGQLPGRRSPMPSQINTDVPENLDDLFDLMTHDDLGQRYQSAEQVLSHIYEHYARDVVLERGALILFEQDPLPHVSETQCEPSVLTAAAIDDEEQELLDDAVAGINDIDEKGQLTVESK